MSYLEFTVLLYLIISYSILAQKWVQIYTFENGLITRMEEFASSAADEDYIVIS